MNDHVQVVRRHVYNSYDFHAYCVEPIFAMFRTQPDAQYLTRDVFKKTHVHIRRFALGVSDSKLVLSGNRPLNISAWTFADADSTSTTHSRSCS
jgi:hypothetical protein